MRWACRDQQKPVLRTCGNTRPSLAERLARRADKQFITCREWLEGPDRPAARRAALAVIIVSIAYMIVHLIFRLCWGG